MPAFLRASLPRRSIALGLAVALLGAGVGIVDIVAVRITTP